MRTQIKIGTRLKQCRETLKTNKTVEEIAEDLGISRGHIHAIEANTKQPSYDLLVKMAAYYGTTTDWILGINGKQKTMPEGATELIDYLSGMSERGRAQLLGIAKTLYEDDREWRQRDDLLKVIRSILGDTTLAAIEAELPAMLAEPTSTDAIVRRILDTLSQNMSSNSG